MSRLDLFMFTLSAELSGLSIFPASRHETSSVEIYPPDGSLFESYPRKVVVVIFQPGLEPGSPVTEKERSLPLLSRGALV